MRKLFSEQNVEKVRKSVSRRIILLGLGKMTLIGILAWRMRKLQIEDSEKYRLQAEENRINMRLIPPERGLILDTRGMELAVNIGNYKLVITREETANPKETLVKLSKLIDLDDKEIEKILSNISKISPFVPITIAEHLSWESFSKVVLNLPALPGISPEMGLTRYYKKPTSIAHVVGYVGPVSKKDLEKFDNPDPVLQIPKFQIGKTGVERELEETLRGKASLSKVEVNATGRIIRETERISGFSGATLQLTLDNELQEYAYQRLSGLCASSVLMEVNSGKIMSLSSVPTFDPNQFVLGISQKYWDSLLNNKLRPLSNKAISGAYPPASTLKMAVALSALETGILSKNDTFECPGHFDLGDQRFHCWKKKGGHGKMDLKQAIAQSCDVYFWEVARKVGIERIGNTAKNLGLGTKFDLPLSSITQGLMPTKSWKKKKFDQPWRVGDTLNAAVGQGFTLASPLQLAVMTSRIASGKAIEPQLIKSIDGINKIQKEFADLNYNKSSLEIIRKGMFSSVNNAKGTAYKSRIMDEETTMAGKTGTSQVRRISMIERETGVLKNEDLPWEKRDHAIFVAYAPFKNPKYAVSIIIEHGGSGAQAAAPIGRDILLNAFYYNRKSIS